jgi:hypothetical protein
MTMYEPGDDVRVTIPEQSDPDHRYHGEVGTVTAVFVDDLGTLIGDPKDDYIYTVAFDADDLATMDFRYRDLTSALSVTHQLCDCYEPLSALRLVSSSHVTLSYICVANQSNNLVPNGRADRLFR